MLGHGWAVAVRVSGAALLAPWRLLHVQFLTPVAPPPVAPAAASDDDASGGGDGRVTARAFVSSVASAIAAALGVPATSYADVDQTVIMRAFAGHGYVARDLVLFVPLGGVALVAPAPSLAALRSSIDEYAKLDVQKCGTVDGVTLGDDLHKQQQQQV